MRLFQKAAFNFLSGRRRAYVLSATFIAAGLYWLIFAFVLGVHGGLLVLSFPSEFKASGIPLRYLVLYGIPALIAFGFACYACLASWGWAGVLQFQ